MPMDYFERLARKRALKRLAVRISMEVVSLAHGISLNDLFGANRRQEVSKARQGAIYLAHVIGQLSINELSIEFAKDRATVAHACHMIEDRRDGPMFDMQMQIMEAEMRKRLEEARDGMGPEIVQELGGHESPFLVARVAEG